MSLHSSRVMFIKQIQIETRNKGGLLLLLAAAVATYIYCGYQSQLGMTQKAEKGQHYSTLKSQKKVREPLFSSYRYYFRLSEQEHTQYSNTHYISNIVDVACRYV